MKNKKIISSFVIGFAMLTSFVNQADAAWEKHNQSWYFKDNNDNYLKNQWVGDYYLGQDGTMLTNSWTPDNYYVGEDGKWIPNLKKGWTKINNKWFFFDKHGDMVKNQWVGDYYLGKKGYMLTNTWTPDNYYVGEDGKWIPNLKKGWTKINNKWFFFDNYGDPVKNKWIDNYYIGEDGVMLTNTWTPDNFYVGEDGKWVPGLKKGWREIHNKWFFFDNNSEPVKNKWIGDYYLGHDGAMLTDTWTPDNFYVGEDGKWVPGLKKGWRKINNKWFFFDNNSEPVKNKWVGEYYLGNDGAMLVNTVTPDNKYVDENGKLVENYTGNKNNKK